MFFIIEMYNFFIEIVLFWCRPCLLVLNVLTITYYRPPLYTHYFCLQIPLNYLIIPYLYIIRVNPI